MEVQRKLALITDPATPMKERLEIEVEMMKNPKEKSYLSEFCQDFDRKKYLTANEVKHQEEGEQLKKNLRKEAKRAAQEQEDFSKARLARQDREMKMNKEVDLHRKKVIAKDSEELRKKAENVVAKVAEKKAREKLEEQERQARIKEFRSKEGTNMPHVNRVLTEALLDQHETKS
jgi:ABC-type proline/glycine betaine transport system ATPase subunit